MPNARTTLPLQKGEDKGCQAELLSTRSQWGAAATAIAHRGSSCFIKSSQYLLNDQNLSPFPSCAGAQRRRLHGGFTVLLLRAGKRCGNGSGSGASCPGMSLEPAYTEIHSSLVMATPTLQPPVADEEFLVCITYLWADSRRNYRLVSQFKREKTQGN